MAKEYLEVIAETANKLDDELTGRVEKGGHSTVYFGQIFVYKVTEKKVMEKSTRINSTLSTSKNKLLSRCVPDTILCRELGENSLVVEDLKKGLHPEHVSSDLLTEIIELLREVHTLDIDQVITNFEGDAIPASEYWTSQTEFAKQYASKLIDSGTLSVGDLELIESCVRKVEDISSSAKDAPRLVLVYKDVHRHNTLVDKDGKLSALIDWDAAMSGPVELEYAVLLARFPELWDEVQPKDLDMGTFIVAGIVQGLRFWKSFTKDSDYVDQQRDALVRLLEL